jgi:hypothetical protein
MTTLTGREKKLPLVRYHFKALQKKEVPDMTGDLTVIVNSEPLPYPDTWHIYTLTRSTEGYEPLTPVAVIGWENNPLVLNETTTRITWMIPQPEEFVWFDKWARKLEAVTLLKLPPLEGLNTVLGDVDDLDRLPFRMFNSCASFSEAYNTAVEEAIMFPLAWEEVVAVEKEKAVNLWVKAKRKSMNLSR